MDLSVKVRKARFKLAYFVNLETLKGQIIRKKSRWLYVAAYSAASVTFHWHCDTLGNVRIADYFLIVSRLSIREC